MSTYLVSCVFAPRPIFCLVCRRIFASLMIAVLLPNKLVPSVFRSGWFRSFSCIYLMV